MRERILHKSPTLKKIVRILNNTADASLPTLLLGETGTGKSYLASFIHQRFRKNGGLFLTLDCATLNPNLIESELFGHEKGAFTGATERKSGLFEFACGGTILLDEVENLSPDIQAKLLRVLDEQKFRRVGGAEEMQAHFHLISTINVDVQQMLESGALREDFYFRIASLELTLPPLRQRREEIMPFARYFLHALSERYGKPFSLTKAAEQYLMAYSWPGNLRELKHVLLAAARLTSNTTLDVADFKPLLRARHARQEPVKLKSLAEVEKEHIAAVLRETGYRMARTAQILGIADNTLRAKMKKYGLK